MRLLATLLLCLLVHLSVKAQTILKTNLLYPTLAGGASLALETATSQRSSLNLYGAFGSAGYLALADTYRFYNFIAEQRFYKASSPANLQGFYYGPYLKFMHRQIYDPGVDLTVIALKKTRDFEGSSVGLGGVVGVQAPIKFIKRTYVDVFLGMGYLVYTNVDDYTLDPENRTGYADLRTGLSIGYKF